MRTEHFWQLILILIGALVSAYAGYWIGHQPEESLFIEYRKDVNKNLKSLIGDTNDIEIRYDGKSLSELSNISYVIANTTTKNMDKFKLYFEISDKKNFPIFHNVNPPKSYPKEAITLISQSDGIYVFELEYLNRSESIWEGLSFSFYFAGEEPPRISVKTGTKGISIKEYENKSLSIIDYGYFIVRDLWWLILLMFLIVYITNRYEKSSIIIRNSDFLIAIEEVIKGDGEPIDKANKIVEVSKKPPSFRKIIEHVFNKEDA